MGKWPISYPQLHEWHAKGIWDTSAQFEHIAVKRFSLNGKDREFCFVWMPHPIRMVPQSLDDSVLYSPEVLQFLRDYVK